MYKSMILLAATLMSVNVAQALSLHPCTPIVEAQPSQLVCKEGSTTVSIEIQTRMSDSRSCPYGQHVEVKTASVQITDASGQVLQDLTMYDGEFEYRLGEFFKSEKYGFDLNDCVSPMDGGVSFGN